MPENSSLDDFVRTGGEAGGTSSDGEVGTDVTQHRPDREGDEGRVDPATPTYEWRPAGVPCDDCTERVTRRWRRGDERVCPDCKDW